MDYRLKITGGLGGPATWQDLAARSDQLPPDEATRLELSLVHAAQQQADESKVSGDPTLETAPPYPDGRCYEIEFGESSCRQTITAHDGNLTDELRQAIRLIQQHARGRTDAEKKKKKKTDKAKRESSSNKDLLDPMGSDSVKPVADAANLEATGSTVARSKLNETPKPSSKQVRRSLHRLRNQIDGVIADASATRASLAGRPTTIATVFFDIGDTLLVPSGSRFVWHPGALDMVHHFSAAGMTLGLISNTPDGSTEASLATIFPVGFFDLFHDSLKILSSQVGMAKPEIEIFYHALTRAGVASNQCLFVTEDLEHTLAAQAAGMQTVRLADPASDFPLLKRLFA